MADRGQPIPDPIEHNARGGGIILALAGGSALAYLLLAIAGDLRDHPFGFLVAHVVLVAGMLVVRRHVRIDHRNLKLALAAALLFRLVATAGEPALSDDVYRYVWDGRVQLHGFHPYAHAPADDALADLRDPNWRRINHPEVKTIYPPLAQTVFLLLASLGAGPIGFKLAMGLADFGVVLLLLRLLRRKGWPCDRVVFYAWNPLAILETAGSGHVEPLGVLLLLLAVVWIAEQRRGLAAAILGLSVQVKLLPLLLAPGYLRRGRWRSAAIFLLVLVVVGAPYALTGPAIGPGLFDYAERWERNAFLYAGVQSLMEHLDTGERLKPVIEAMQERFPDALPWSAVYRHVWPRDVARMLVALLVLAWLAWVITRRGSDPVREALWILGAVLLLAPTLHPWYVLWILPFAAARLSRGWLLFGVTVPLAYWTRGDDVPWIVRSIEYLPVFAVMLFDVTRARIDRKRSTVC